MTDFQEARESMTIISLYITIKYNISCITVVRIISAFYLVLLGSEIINIRFFIIVVFGGIFWQLCERTFVCFTLLRKNEFTTRARACQQKPNVTIILKIVVNSENDSEILKKLPINI